MYPVTVTPARDEANSNATVASVRALAAVVSETNANPAARNLADVAKQMDDASPEDNVSVIETNTPRVIICDTADAKAAARGLTGTKKTVLTPDDIGKSAPVWTASGDSLADTLGAGADAFAANNITAAPPTVSPRTLLNEITVAAKAGSKNVSIVVDKAAGTVSIITDTGANVAAMGAAVIAEKEETGLFAVINGTEVTPAGTVQYLKL